MHPDELDQLAERPFTRGDRAWIACCAFLSVFVTGGQILHLARKLLRLIY